MYEVAPDPWGQVIFFYNYVEHIPGDFDREIVSSLLEQYVGSAETEVRAQINHLNTPEGELMSVMLTYKPVSSPDAPDLSTAYSRL